MTTRRKDLRNIAIVAHVDHGKTTLVDAMFRQTDSFQGRQGSPTEQMMDTNDLERERGITILSKCTSVPWKDMLINIVDTPGHADFGSEVERILTMVDGVLLLVDAADGPMPQTRYVLRKALGQGLSPIVVINKLDQANARPGESLNDVYSLFIDLGAQEHQLDFPVIYASAREGWASLTPDTRGKDLGPLFESIVAAIPPPMGDTGGPLKLMVTMADYSNYVGGVGIGRVRDGNIRQGQTVCRVRPDGSSETAKVARLEGFYGLERRPMESAQAGDIVAVSGFEGIVVGDTVSAVDDPTPLPPISVDEPTMSMEFMVNDSPFAGREGKFVTSRHIKNRLERERRASVGLRVEDLPGEGHFKVSGRGELQLSILIETMRREGFELAVSRPEVVCKEVDGKLCEPVEALVLDIEPAYQGVVYEAMGTRSARMIRMDSEGGRLRIEYVIPARSLLGFKGEFMTMTRGTGIMHHCFHGFEPKTGARPLRANGVFVAKENGISTGYALFNLQDRAVMFVGPGVAVYTGMIVGENSRENDLVVNPCKAKHLSNMRSKASDDALALTPPKIMTLEQAIEYLDTDELLEATPVSLRLRKKVLNAGMRKRSEAGD